MTIDPAVELAFWRELAWETWQRGHRKLARELWGAALNEYADATAASTNRPRRRRPTAQRRHKTKENGGVTSKRK